MANKKDREPTLYIRRAPRLGEIFWCQMPQTIYRQEFGYDGKEYRPVMILSKKNRLYGTAQVIPLSTAKQKRPQEAVKMKSYTLFWGSKVVHF